MSNGKSTLANALIGRTILPTSNLTCTTLTIQAIDCAHDKQDELALYQDNNQTMDVGSSISSALLEKNAEGGGVFLFQTSLNKLNHGRFPISIVDTPGINDGLDSTYRDTAMNFLRKIKKPVPLLVSNVRSCGTTDEQRCIASLADVMKQQKISTWFVAVNGWNLTDPERDKQCDYVDKIYYLANECELPRPQVFCVSALPAALCRKAISGEILHGSERILLDGFLSQCDLESRVRANRRKLGKISKKTLRTALYQTGIPELEDALFRCFIKMVKDYKTSQNSSGLVSIENQYITQGTITKERSHENL